MGHPPDFDIEGALGILKSFIEQHAEGSKERAAFELAQIALLYPRHLRQENDFRRYHDEFFDPSFKVDIAHEFSTRRDADQWLASGKAREAQLVTIEGRGFQVARLPGRLMFIDRPLPDEMAPEEPETESD